MAAIFRQRIRRTPVTIVGGLSLLLVNAALGDGVERFDFSLRFPAAISRFASYGDVAAMGNAQVASVYSSSSNPASAASAHPEQKLHNSFSPQATALRFDAGTNLYVTSESVVLDAGERGVFIPAVAQIFSNHKADRSGTGFEFSGDLVQLQWAKRITEGTAIGANFNVTFSNIHQDIPGFFDARARSKSYNLRVGVLQKITPQVRFGATLDLTRAPGKTDLSFFDPVSSSVQTARLDDTTDQGVVRTGVAWEYSKDCVFAVDYQAGVFRNDTGRLRVHRFPVGIEHQFFDRALYLRAGATFDTRGEVSGTAGFGVSLGTRGSLDAAYQHDMFPEIKPEFGKAKAYTLSVGILF